MRAPKKSVPAKECEDEMREKRREKMLNIRKYRKKLRQKFVWFQRYKRHCKH